MTKRQTFSVVEICAGGGGQAIGLEAAGFEHALAIEIDAHACATLRLNRPHWKVEQKDVRDVSGGDLRGIDLLAGGVPCPPFSIAGKQLGPDDERDLFPDALRLVEEIRPTAVMLENVRGLASTKFDSYREGVLRRLSDLGYEPQWRVVNASDYGVPQLRPRFILVAIKTNAARFFKWPVPLNQVRTVAESIGDLMAIDGWKGAGQWMKTAASIAPTIVGGSKKHGGPDLGPTRARKQWAELGVDGLGIGNAPPAADFPEDGKPKLTLRMVARIQGFPDDWQLSGGKTAAYRQVGNAFPPPVASAIGTSIKKALIASRRSEPKEKNKKVEGQRRLKTI